MRAVQHTRLFAPLALWALAPGTAHAASVWDRAIEASLQCVPFAREVSGVAIYGDALSWWGQADGRYERGRAPRVGAVMAFTPHRGMTLGHVAVVRRIVSPREVRLDHSNWSPINGRRGQIERDVRAVDVSSAGDWSQVRVWFGPIEALGGTAWPVTGFIYPKGGDASARIASSERAERQARERWAGARPAPAPVAVAALAPSFQVAAAATPTPAQRRGALSRLSAWRSRSEREGRLASLAPPTGRVKAETPARTMAPSSPRVARAPALAAASVPTPSLAPTLRSSGAPQDLLALTRHPVR